jgi:hypothetical protein
VAQQVPEDESAVQQRQHDQQPDNGRFAGPRQVEPACASETPNALLVKSRSYYPRK